MNSMMTLPRRSRGGVRHDYLPSTGGPSDDVAKRLHELAAEARERGGPETWYFIGGESWDDGTHAFERMWLAVANGSTQPAPAGWVAVFEDRASGKRFTRPVAAWAEAYPVTEQRYRRPPWALPLPVGLLNRGPLRYTDARRLVGVVCREDDGALVPAENSNLFARYEWIASAADGGTSVPEPAK